MPRKTLRTLVVDDEPVARRVLLEDLAEMDNVSVIGEADNGGRALQQIEALRPDLVLLDIQMPVMDGFQVLRQLQGPLPSIIFVTAYSEHALNAFEVGAVDYLLKPVSPDRLHRAVERAQAALGKRLDAAERVAQTLGAAAAGEQRQVVKIAARKGTDYYLLDLDEVFAFQADREIVWIRTRDKSYMATQTLQGHRRSLERHPLSAGPSQRSGQPGQGPQDKHSQQPALVADSDQRTGIHREQAADSPAPGHAALSHVFRRVDRQWNTGDDCCRRLRGIL